MKKFTSLLKDNETKTNKESITVENRIRCDGSDGFYSAFFNMEKWWLAATNIGQKKGPYIFIGEPEGIRSLLLFTSDKKASDFAKDNKIETNENGKYVIVKTPLNVITSIGTYRALRIERVIIDLCWQVELEQFKKLYFLYVKDYNFKKLVGNVNTRLNPMYVRELWTMVFNLPAWYFIGDIEKGIVYGNTINFDKVVFLFLSRREAIRGINETNTNYNVYKYKPQEGYEFLLFMQKEANVSGVMLREKGVRSGARIENIVKIKEIFEI